MSTDHMSQGSMPSGSTPVGSTSSSSTPMGTRHTTHGVPSDPHAHHHDGHSDDPCRAAMEKIQEFLHAELDEDTANLIREHLASCAMCEDQFEVEATITRLIRRTRCGEQVSETLRARLSTLSVRPRH